jgi:adhesin transport system outer membrane protein
MVNKESNTLFSMKKTFSHWLCGAAFLAGAWMPLTPVRAESLYDAVQTAITTHPSVTAAEAAKDASHQSVREARSDYFPEIAANITGGRVYGDNSTSRGLSVTRGAGYSGYGEGSASLTQRVYDWGETGNKVDAAKARELAAQSGVTSTQEQIALRAVQSYIALLRATHLKQAAKDNLSNIEDYQKKIAAQVEEGGSDDAELNRANDFLLLAKNAATEFDGQFQQALADYVEAVGNAPQNALKRPILPATFPVTVDEAIDAAFAGHPQVQAAKDAVIAGDHDMRAESTTVLPKVSAQLSYLKRDQSDIIGGEATDARAVMKMDWNYDVGGAQLARKDRAKMLKAQAKAQLNETYRRIEHDVRVAWSALDIVREQQKTQENRKAATAKVVDTYKTQYEGGNRTLIELMQAESQAFDASVAYDNADYGVLNATYTLLAATGQLVAGLQPLAHTEGQSESDVIAPQAAMPDAVTAQALPASAPAKTVTQTTVTTTTVPADAVLLSPSMQSTAHDDQAANP